MITNGNLIVLLPPAPLCSSESDYLHDMIHDASLRGYFATRATITSTERIAMQTKSDCNNQTIIVVERGRFPEKESREEFKSELEKVGVPSKHILFGEDYASGYHHIALKIHELCR